MVNEVRTGRNDLIQQIRSEIKLLARTVAVANEDFDK